ncbi:hypothetical protein BBP40_005269 [Aspergillus hancockii]|nr:hypothetical protein BBP40_005269 [Aspergillus hancockii]
MRPQPYSRHVNIDDLRSSSHDILLSKMASAFTDGKISTEYHRERFSLLQTHGLKTIERMDRLLETYKGNLRASLKLNPGSLQLLKRLRNLGKRAIQVTESSQDAQKWTVQELGLQLFIDILVSANGSGNLRSMGYFLS